MKATVRSGDRYTPAGVHASHVAAVAMSKGALGTRTARTADTTFHSTSKFLRLATGRFKDGLQVVNTGCKTPANRPYASDDNHEAVARRIGRCRWGRLVVRQLRDSALTCICDGRGTNQGQIMSTIEERISKLEQQMRNGEFDLLRVKKGLAVFDEKSEPRIFLSVDSSGDPFITVTSAEGKTAMHIGTNEGSSEVILKDAAGTLRLKLSVSEEANPMVMLCGTNGEPQLSLSVIDNAPRLMLHDADGAMRIATSVYPVPHIQIYGKDEKPRVNLSLDGDEADVCTVDSHGRKTRAL
jgi:hypothetical protein